MDALVPERTIFLAFAKNAPGCSKSKPIERRGSIPHGTNTVFFPLASARLVDYEDDFEAKICANTTEEAEQARMDLFVLYRNTFFKNKSFTSTLYATLDGEAMTQIYIEDTSKFYMTSCPNGALCADSCDVPESEDCGGVDMFPNLGYYAKDTRYWKRGEKHVFEFGANGDTDYICGFTKYTLTAA